MTDSVDHHEARRRYSAEEVARRAKGLYERRIREEVEPGGANEGRFLAVDVESGDYEGGSHPARTLGETRTIS